MSRLVALYPRAWRDRYEDEYLALLAERPPDPRASVDIVRGAIDARIHPQVPGSPKVPVERPPIGRWSVAAGWSTLVGAVLWYVGIVLAATGPMVVDDGEPYRDGSAALPFLFMAMVGLVVGMIAIVLSIPPSRRANAAVTVGSISGLLWAGAPWLFWFGLLTFGCLIAIGGLAWRSGGWSAWRFAALVACIASPWALGFLALSGIWPAPAETQFALFGLGGLTWLVVGTSLAGPWRTSDATLGTRQG